MSFEQAPVRRERILYTRHDGGVSICCPSANAIRWMSLGGRWADYGRGYVEVQIERQIADGIDEWTARRFAHAMAYGGLTDADALGVIRDRDCGRFGTAFELLDVDEVPTDRWFRNAWRRGHNGGPIYIDLPEARRIQTKKIKDFAIQHKLTLCYDRWKHRIRKVTTPEELKTIWPETKRR